MPFINYFYCCCHNKFWIYSLLFLSLLASHIPFASCSYHSDSAVKFQNGRSVKTLFVFVCITDLRFLLSKHSLDNDIFCCSVDHATNTLALYSGRSKFTSADINSITLTTKYACCVMKITWFNACCRHRIFNSQFGHRERVHFLSNQAIRSTTIQWPEGFWLIAICCCVVYFSSQLNFIYGSVFLF